VIRCLGTYTPSTESIRAEVGDQTITQYDETTGEPYEMPAYSAGDIEKLRKDRTGYRTFDVTVGSDGTYITESLGGIGN
jgi:hypothetical protein